MERMSGGTAGAMETLRVRVDRWRAGCGGKRSRVPEELWNAAVAEALRSGVYATSKATRFHYGGLKDRVERAAKVGLLERSAPAFIEVAMAPVTSREVGSKMVVELEGRRGVRLRVEMTGMRPVDVVELAHAFWRREECSN